MDDQYQADIGYEHCSPTRLTRYGYFDRLIDDGYDSSSVPVRLQGWAKWRQVGRVLWWAAQDAWLPLYWRARRALR